MTPHAPTLIRAATAAALALTLAGCTGAPDAGDLTQRLGAGVEEARSTVEQAQEAAGDAPAVQSAVATAREALAEARAALDDDADGDRLARARGSLDEAAQAVDRAAESAGSTAGAVLERLGDQIRRLSADLEDAAGQVR
ncbi:hypothetical protein [Cellulomonas bogoriensis]|uniref:Mucin n=1 Tax=Cellulomonas bogoriensis 69B4 = DSM 16987 TaxID=1386082 RepID=A0A0A0C0B9_9CELL|nr:hypothetical protein [Cellulomonas bogoriensis]KGM13626.1 hypothetical protein N869_12755 [Cellulomonas bogoriensis 69B4 = DSM 16987]